MTQISREKLEEFFLENFNVDRIFNTIERADYLFLHYIVYCRKESELENGVYLTEIADVMQIPITQVSKAVKQLQDKGYVTWKTNAEKDRTYVELTSTAIELMNDEHIRMKKFYERILEEVPADEMAAMIKTMKKITDIVEETAKNED